MNEMEAARVLKLIARPHNVKVDTDLLEIWYNSALARCDYFTGLSIARQLAEYSQHMAKPAAFNELVRLRSLPERRKIAPSLEESTWPPDPEVKARVIAEMREVAKKLRQNAKTDRKVNPE